LELWPIPRIVSVLGWLIAVAWLLRVLEWRFRLRAVPDLTNPACATPSGILPRLSVIVPARNEEANITATLRSLVASEGVDLQIIAVDDRSTDQTGKAMDALSRCAMVLHVEELPRGWLGKTHAMALGAELAIGDWLLFTDADVLFHPDALRRALQFAVTSSADHVVLLPTVLLRSWGERMTIAFLQVLSIWGLRVWRVPDPRAKRDAIGVGAFNLIRRDVYDALGGWEAFRMEVLEDLTLGRRVKEKGYAQRVALGLDLVSVRWAQGAFGVVDNLTKNLFALCAFRPERVLGLVAGIALFTLFPLLTGWPALLLLVTLILAYQTAGKYHHFTAAQLPMFPLASVLLQYALLRSMFQALWRGGVTWRGTFYSLKDLRRNATPPR
jgi:cellulose synthase/poly-beta-1,6-N-acetylglucosamine synthase-like glycosyltransferase